MKWLEVGQGTLEARGYSVDSGRQLAEGACSRLRLTPQLAFFFATPDSNIKFLLHGIKSYFESHFDLKPIPLIGCSTPFPIGIETTGSEGAVLTVLAAREDHLSARVVVAERVFDDPDLSVKNLLSSLGIHDAIRDGRRGFLTVFTPGFQCKDSEVGPPGRVIDQRLVKAIVDQVGMHVPLFGGSAADRYDRRKANEYVDYCVFEDSLVIGFVETKLTFSSFFDVGIYPTDERFSIDAFANGESSGQIVTKIDGMDARALVDTLISNPSAESDPSGPPVLFAVADDVNGLHIARPFLVPDYPTSLMFQRPVGVKMSLRPAIPDRSKMVAAAKNAAGEACKIHHLRQSAFGLSVSCAGRPDLFVDDRNGYANEEISGIKGGLPEGTVLTGFFGYGEHGVNIPAKSTSQTFAVGVLVIGSDLTPSALLLEKLRALSRVSADIQLLVNERDIANSILNALNEVGYGGGMISFIEPIRGPHKANSVRAAFALNAIDDEWGRWEDIRQETIRRLPGKDVLAQVLAGELPSPTVILKSEGDITVNQASCRRGRVSGQIVFRLEDPFREYEPFGTLQIGTIEGYEPPAVELEALKTIVQLAARSFANFRSQNGLRDEFRTLYTVASQAVGGADINKLLGGLLSLSANHSGADYASLRLVDPSRNRLCFSALYPPDDDAFWTRKRRLTTMPVRRASPSDSYKWVGTWVCEHRESYRSNATDRPLLNRFAGDEVVGDLSIPVIVGEELLGVLAVNSKVRHFSEADESRLTMLSRIAAVAIMYANAKVQAETLHRITDIFWRPDGRMGLRSDALSRLDAVASVIRTAAHATSCSIYLVDPKRPNYIVLCATTNEFFRARIGVEECCIRPTYVDDLTGAVALKREPIRLMDIQSENELARDYAHYWDAGVRQGRALTELEGIASERVQFLCVPIIWKESPDGKGELEGVIRCLITEGVQTFTFDDEKLLGEAADLVALGLQHASAANSTVEHNTWREYAGRVFRHQLLTPLLGAVHGLSLYKSRWDESITDGSPPPEPIEISKWIRDLSNTRKIIEDLSVLSQMENLSSPALPMAPVRLDTLVRDAIRQVEDHYLFLAPQAKKPQLLMTNADPYLSVSGYSVFLCEAVVNLITNALKATEYSGVISIRISVVPVTDKVPNDAVAIRPQGAHVIATWAEALPLPLVSGSEKNEVVTISVTDHGTGIAADDVGTIFDIGGSRWNQSYLKGAGLGLSIVWDTMRAHDGGITLATKPGYGSVFTLVVPKEHINGV